MGNRLVTNEASTLAWRNGEKDYLNEKKDSASTYGFREANLDREKWSRSEGSLQKPKLERTRKTEILLRDNQSQGEGDISEQLKIFLQVG